MAAFAIRDWHVNIHCRRFIVSTIIITYTHRKNTQHSKAKPRNHHHHHRLSIGSHDSSLNNTTKYYLQW